MKRFIFTSIFSILFASSVYAADTKVTDLTADTSPTSDDLVMTVDAPGTSPVNKKVTLSDLSKGIVGGSDTYVQFNDNGSFNGTSAYTFNKTTNTTTTGILSATGGNNSMIGFANGANITGNNGTNGVSISGGNNSMIGFSNGLNITGDTAGTIKSSGNFTISGNGSSLKMSSPNGTNFSITVSDLGVVTAS